MTDSVMSNPPTVGEGPEALGSSAKTPIPTETVTLLPCPFCGGPGEPVKQRWSRRDYHGVRCDGDCGTFFDCRAEDSEDAAEAWNTPAMIAATQQPVSEGVGWRPIETHDGLDGDVDVWLAPLDEEGNALTPCRQPNAWFEVDGWWCWPSGAVGPVRINHRITHWMPKPAPPAPNPIGEEKPEGES